MQEQIFFDPAISLIDIYYISAHIKKMTWYMSLFIKKLSLTLLIYIND